MNDFLEIALSCLKRGWYVFPCVPRTKEPLGGLVPHGVLDASNDEAVIRRWWAIKPEANVAVACGPSGLTVVDCDHGNATEADAREWIRRAGLPETYTVHTGRRWDEKDPERKPEYGVQLYYSESMPSVGEFALAGGSGQVKSLGGYVMASGSIHPVSGEAYEELVGVPLARLPDFVRALKTERKLVEDDGGPIDHDRNLRLTSMAGKMRNAGFTHAAMEAALLQVNDDRCAPPLPEEEVKRIAVSVARYEVPAELKVTIGGAKTQPEPAKLPERAKPKYPDSAWEDTVVGEYAKRCAHDNNIPRKMYAEAFRCVLGAVVGDRLSCPSVEGALPRTYTILAAPKGKGKGTAIRRAVQFFKQPCDGWNGPSNGSGIRVSFSDGLLSGQRDFMWKPKGIGAWEAAAASVPGMARLCKEPDSTAKNKPQLTWGGSPAFGRAASRRARRFDGPASFG